MATVYKFTVSMPVTDLLPRNRISNTFHMQHTAVPLNEDVEAICQDIIALYQAQYENSANEVQCKAYHVGNPPQFPVADVIVNAGTVWTVSTPREIALVLSYAGEHRGNRRQRGRIYLMPALRAANTLNALRPSIAVQQWALDFYTESNQSFPDLGGVDWKFGIWSHVAQEFTQSKQAWVNDEWDTQRRRGLREASRLSASREG